MCAVGVGVVWGGKMFREGERKKGKNGKGGRGRGGGTFLFSVCIYSETHSVSHL